MGILMLCVGHASLLRVTAVGCDAREAIQAIESAFAATSEAPTHGVQETHRIEGRGTDMKATKSKGKLAATNTVRTVTFVCGVKPDAAEAFLVGAFNQWDPKADPMAREDGRFVKSMRLPPGEHQYKFLVDGEWHADPAAATQVPNAFGTVNSVVSV
jgi:1,4-alpha-glucan branching enzyme